MMVFCRWCDAQVYGGMCSKCTRKWYETIAETCIEYASDNRNCYFCNRDGNRDVGGDDHNEECPLAPLNGS